MHVQSGARAVTRKKPLPARREADEEAAPLPVDRAQLARLLGISTRQVSYLESDGILKPMKRGKGGRASRFDALEVVPAYIARLTAEDGDTLAPRDRKDLAQARLTELRVQRETGVLIERDLVVRAGQQYTRAWVAKLRVLPRQLANAGLIPLDLIPAIEARIRALQEDIAAWRVPDDDPTDSRNLEDDE